MFDDDQNNQQNIPNTPKVASQKKPASMPSIKPMSNLAANPTPLKKIPPAPLPKAPQDTLRAPAAPKQNKPVMPAMPPLPKKKTVMPSMPPLPPQYKAPQPPKTSFKPMTPTPAYVPPSAQPQQVPVPPPMPMPTPQPQPQPQQPIAPKIEPVPQPLPTPSSKSNNFFDASADAPAPAPQPAGSKFKSSIPIQEHLVLSDEEQREMIERDKLSSIQKIILIIVTLIVIGSLIGGGIWLYLTVDPFAEEPVSVENENTNQVEENINKPAVIDTDGDGLSDEDEAKYKTDPNIADTDGDGFSDGQEVSGGYNPLGEGNL